MKDLDVPKKVDKMIRQLGGNTSLHNFIASTSGVLRIVAGSYSVTESLPSKADMHIVLHWVSSCNGFHNDLVHCTWQALDGSPFNIACKSSRRFFSKLPFGR